MNSGPGGSTLPIVVLWNAIVDGVRVSSRTGRIGRRAKGGAFTNTGQIKSGITTVVMFVLLPQVRMPKRLDVMRAADQWSRIVPGLIGKRMGRRD